MAEFGAKYRWNGLQIESLVDYCNRKKKEMLVKKILSQGDIDAGWDPAANISEIAWALKDEDSLSPANVTSGAKFVFCSTALKLIVQKRVGNFTGSVRRELVTSVYNVYESWSLKPSGSTITPTTGADLVYRMFAFDRYAANSLMEILSMRASSALTSLPASTDQIDMAEYMTDKDVAQAHPFRIYDSEGSNSIAGGDAIVPLYYWASHLPSTNNEEFARVVFVKNRGKDLDDEQ